MADALETQADIIFLVAEFADGYLFFALVSRRWKSTWESRGLPKATTYPFSVSQLLFAFDSGLPRESTPMCKIAARRGNLDVLRCAWTNGGTLDGDTLSAAALEGHLHVLQWAVLEIDFNEDDITTDLCHSAAIGGHLDVLQWARANQLLWDERTCAAAAGGGHLDVLMWAHENGCP